MAVFQVKGQRRDKHTCLTVTVTSSPVATGTLVLSPMLCIIKRRGATCPIPFPSQDEGSHQAQDTHHRNMINCHEEPHVCSPRRDIRNGNYYCIYCGRQMS